MRWKFSDVFVRQSLVAMSLYINREDVLWM